MKHKLVNSQLTNWQTYNMYLRQMLTLAENVFEFKNIPTYIDISYLNKTLLRNGAIAFFTDEVLGLLALPFVNLGTLDVYNRPKDIQVIAPNGSYQKKLKPNEYVIMYDNNGRYPLYLDIAQIAERIALDTRVTDINIAQQRTPRIWKTKQEQVKTLNDLINNIDGNVNQVCGYNDIDLDETSIILDPAPYVADKIDQHKEKDWNEFLRLIGVANMNFQKKERNIKDEVLASQGGTVASRYSRFDPRKKAVDEINKKFSGVTTLDGKLVLETPIEVSYYDGLPTSLKDLQNDVSEENPIDESEVDNND